MKSILKQLKNHAFFVSIVIVITILIIRILPLYIEFKDSEEFIAKNVNNVGFFDTEFEDTDDYKSNLQENDKSNILYEKVIDDKIIIRVKYLDSVLAQRSLIGIEKTVDGGKTWVEQLENSDKCIQIHNGAKFVFINENIGFINDPGLAGTNGENRELLVTVDGGKNFTQSNIIHPDSIEEKNLFIKELPFEEDGKLKVQIYTINHNKDPEKTYYEFYSEDNGLNWIYK